MEWKVFLIKNKFLIGGIILIVLINIVALIQWNNKQKFGSDEFWAEPTIMLGPISLPTETVGPTETPEPTATPWPTDAPSPTATQYLLQLQPIPQFRHQLFKFSYFFQLSFTDNKTGIVLNYSFGFGQIIFIPKKISQFH